jgi:hypothetical protein
VGDGGTRCATAVRAAGRPAIGWAGPALAHLVATLTGATRWWPHLPRSEAPSAPPPGKSARLRAPAEYGRLALAGVQAAGSDIGLLDDAAGRNVTVVFAVAGPDRFALADPAEQDRLIAAWGRALTALSADSSLRRLQWCERATRPGGGQSAAWMARQPDAASRPGYADYQAMVASVGADAVTHQVHLAVQLARPPRAGQAELAGLASRAQGMCAPLAAAELVARPLAADELGWLLRSYVDPVLPDSPDAPAANQIGPACRRVFWDHVRTDELAHRSYVITGFPRSLVGPGWLEPMLLTAPDRTIRHLAVHLTPVAPAQAARAARAGRARTELDRTDRTRLGFTPPLAPTGRPSRRSTPRKNSSPATGRTGSPACSLCLPSSCPCSPTRAGSCARPPPPPASTFVRCTANSSWAWPPYCRSAGYAPEGRCNAARPHGLGDHPAFPLGLPLAGLRPATGGRRADRAQRARRRRAVLL